MPAGRADIFFLPGTEEGKKGGMRGDERAKQRVGAAQAHERGDGGAAPSTDLAM